MLMREIYNASISLCDKFRFNYKNIYFHKRLANYIKYAELIINSIFNALKDFYAGANSIAELDKNAVILPLTIKSFKEWILKYSNADTACRKENKYSNKVLYDLSVKKDYLRAALDFIACMTDHFAINIFNELISF